MRLNNAPSKIQTPFAENGIKNAIPVPSQTGVKPGAASFTDGFPPLTMTPLAAGGVPPDGADVNGVLNAITSIQRWQCAGGQFRYDAEFAQAVGGYPLGAMLAKANGEGYWLNLIDGNTTNPDAGGAGWRDNYASPTPDATDFSNANATTSFVHNAIQAASLSGSGSGGNGGGGDNSGNYPRPRVVVMGDTFSSQMPLMGTSWPEFWAEMMTGAGAPIDLINISSGGWTFYRASNDTSAYVDGKTMVDRAIELAPNVLIVTLSATESLFAIDGRSDAQIQADATTVFTKLREALPNTTIVWARNIMYDEFTANDSSIAITALKSINVLPAFHTKSPASNPVYSGCYGDTSLTITSEAADRHQSLKNIQTWLLSKQGSFYDAVMPLDFWRASRLGFSAMDSVHFNESACRLIAAYAQKSARSLAPLIKHWPGIRWRSSGDINDMLDPDSVFSSILHYNKGFGYDITQYSYFDNSVHATMAFINTAGAPHKIDTWWATRSGARVSVQEKYAWNANFMNSVIITGAHPGMPVFVHIRGNWVQAGVISGDGQLIANQEPPPVDTVAGNLYVKVFEDVFELELFTLPSFESRYPPHIELALTTPQNTTSSPGLSTPLSMSMMMKMGAGNWNGNTYTVKLSGRYHVMFQANRSARYVPAEMYASVFVNGEVRILGTAGYCYQAGQEHGSSATGTIYLVEGDSVQFRVTCSEDASGNYAWRPGMANRAIAATLSYVGP